ncbi:response regulator [Piscirickettsia litoralis]|uniref:Response regulatory domain-containing protein n=1 Tax=Piscirickettsia litoralis TaxID=1891921 RepID=A0ABX3A1U0_9GAMM|nr:response regulator [Piscirickettsia litoralis]ODN42793.1 hypothetical protein BGC07_07495 [Piscirickettsia litoralis]
MKTTRLQLLLVEDDLADQKLVLLALAKINFPYQLQIKNDGEEALQHIINTQDRPDYPDAMLLDLNLPKRSGQDILKRLNIEAGQGSNLSKIYTVMFTTSKFSQDKQKAGIFGADAYFEKTDHLQDYINLLNTVYIDCMANS